ncbi:MAG: DUF2461 domain-containing protein [Paludibacteraceae bacterium]|nr:DUF2461 domain-containing protein [Paludibacteraceae bacterium]
MNKDTLLFLKDLAVNNNREWFAENKQRYEAARQDVLQLTRHLIERIAEFDDEIKFLEPKDCLFRIYRDIRFREDKSPYKRHFGTYIAKNGGHRSKYSGYYVHLEPGNCVLAGGIWCPDSAGIKKLRDIIDTEHETLRAILNEKDFVRFFGNDLVRSADALKSVPRGYPKDHPAAEWLKLKSIIVECPIDDSTVDSDDFEDFIIEGCRAMYRFSHWCNDAFFEN